LVLLGELARHEPGAGTDAAPSVLRVVVPRHVATAAALGLGGEQLGIDAGGLAERARVKEPAVACPGVPVAGVQKTTIRPFTVRVRRKTKVFVHTFWGRKLLILPTFTVVFHPRKGSGQNRAKMSVKDLRGCSRQEDFGTTK